MTDFLIRRLDATDRRPHFDCADDDLNEFFHKDSIESCGQLMAVTYSVEDIQSKEILGFFCVSNDSIKKQDVPKNNRRHLLKRISSKKRYSSLPAVKIGRLGIGSSKQSRGLGTEVLNFIKGWFTKGNKTGCRFIIVDAYNKDETIRFYRKNGFLFLTDDDQEDQTRLMYFDLITFKD